MLKKLRLPARTFRSNTNAYRQWINPLGLMPIQIDCSKWAAQFRKLLGHELG